jgi:serpin B
MRAMAAIVRPEQPVEVKVDRPFLFAIQHRPSGACIFLGRVTDPRE